jgi:hypothetical protein
MPAPGTIWGTSNQDSHWSATAMAPGHNRTEPAA